MGLDGGVLMRVDLHTNRQFRFYSWRQIIALTLI